MTINRPKLATRNGDLRTKLFSEPLQTCRELGVLIDTSVFDSGLIQPFFDRSARKGGYRP